MESRALYGLTYILKSDGERKRQRWYLECSAGSKGCAVRAVINGLVDVRGLLLEDMSDWNRVLPWQIFIDLESARIAFSHHPSLVRSRAGHHAFFGRGSHHSVAADASRQEDPGLGTLAPMAGGLEPQPFPGESTTVSSFAPLPLCPSAHLPMVTSRSWVATPRQLDTTVKEKGAWLKRVCDSEPLVNLPEAFKAFEIGTLLGGGKLGAPEKHLIGCPRPYRAETNGLGRISWCPKKNGLSPKRCDGYYPSDPSSSLSDGQMPTS